MRRICIALSALIPLICEAAKLTHYADSSFVVKYPMNESTNTPPANPPRWLDENCIPGGSHPSNQVKRMTLDVACSMAGTADAYLRRNIAATLFGTKEMAGYMIGTQHVTGAEYATTNFLASDLFEKHVLDYGPNSPYDLRQFPFAYTNLDYYSVHTNGVHAGNTRRLFCDQYLLKAESMLAGVLETNEYTSLYSRELEFNIRDMVFARCSTQYESPIYSDRWMHCPPIEIINYNGDDGISFDSVPYVYGLSIAWGSSFAERSVYGGNSNSDWLTDPNDLVDDWACFFPTIANIFAVTNCPYYSTDPSYKNLDYSVLDSRPGYLAFQTYLIDDDDYPFIARLRANLHGSFDSDEYGSIGDYKPYPGRNGFELMSDTCGHEITNFNPVVSRRMIYEPWEQCNSFLGLVDTLYIGQDAMPELVYSVTNQTGIVSQAWDIASITVGMDYDNDDGVWHATGCTIEGLHSVTNFMTNITEFAGFTRQQTIGFYLPAGELNLTTSITNRQFTRINTSDDIIFIDEILTEFPDDEIGYIWISGDGDSVSTHLYIGGFYYEREWGNYCITNHFSAQGTWKATGIKTCTFLTDYDRTLMSQTNSRPCIHPINMDVPLDDVESINVCYFSGVHSSTNEYMISETKGDLYESLLATNSLYNMHSTVLNSASAVDYYSRTMSESVFGKIGSISSQLSGYNSNVEAHAAVFNAWRWNLREVIASGIASNKYHRGFHTLAVHYSAPYSAVQIKRDSEGKLRTRYVPSGTQTWDLFEVGEDIDYLKVYWIFNIDGLYNTDQQRKHPSCVVKGATTSIGAVKYDFKTMKREE